MAVRVQGQTDLNDQMAISSAPDPHQARALLADNPIMTSVPAPTTLLWQRRHFLGLAFTVLILVTLGCSASDLLARPTDTPVPTRPPAPTFTPTPDTILPLVVVTPPHDGTPGVIIVPSGIDPNQVIALPTTATPTPTPTATLDALASPIPPTLTVTPIPTDTPLPTFTPPPSLTPTPFVAIASGAIDLRTGPGVQYSLVYQLGPNIPIPLVGRNQEGTWWQLCCVSGALVWVAATHVQVHNNPEGVPVVPANPPPPATPTIPPTPTGTATPTPTATLYPFERVAVPQNCFTNQEFLTIRAKIYVGPPGGIEETEKPLAGYFLKVKYEGFDRVNTAGEKSSVSQFAFSAAPGAGCRVKYNYKYEYMAPDPKKEDPTSQISRTDAIDKGTWSVYVVDGAGNQLSAVSTFTTLDTDKVYKRDMYFVWIRLR